MNKSFVIKNNKIIASFLGGEVREVWIIQGKSEFAWFGEIAEKWRKEKLRISVGTAIFEEQLLFHESWEWLMPVIQKCLEVDITDFKLPYFGIFRRNNIKEHLCKIDKYNTWVDVIYFINWYNTAKNKL